MYRITIIDSDDNKIIRDLESDAYVFVAEDTKDEDNTEGAGNGIYAGAGINGATAMTTLKLLMSMDSIKGQIVKDNPIIGLAYGLKDGLVEKMIIHDLLGGTTTTEEFK